VGADYNEDLLEAMARSGDGNYYYIQSPDQLPAMFQTELLGLLALVGRRARLRLVTTPGVELSDVLNDLERDPDGALTLPNLIGGLPVEVVVRLTIQPGVEATPLVRFQVEYESPSEGAQVITQELTLPAVESATWEALPTNPDVLERGVLQLAGRAKRQLARHLDRQEVEAAREVLRQARSSLDGLPATERVEQERRDLGEIERFLEQGDLGSTRKTSTSQHYQRSHSKR
jgi:Ca-activated chloride channel family protein